MIITWGPFVIWNSFGGSVRLILSVSVISVICDVKLSLHITNHISQNTEVV